MTTTTEITLRLPDGSSTSGLFLRPSDAFALFVFAHGAGAGMRHAFMEKVASGLAEIGIATLRYQFPYMEAGSRRPDRPAQLHATVLAALARAKELAPALPLLAGGKSMGGRMTSAALADSPDPAVQGILFLGFPLHPPKQPSITRGAHLQRVQTPMLFLQGTRDELADLDLLMPVVKELGPHARLHVVSHADHGFDVLKRSGRTSDDVHAELLATITEWLAELGVHA